MRLLGEKKTVENYCELCKTQTHWERDISRPVEREYHCLGSQNPPHYTSLTYLAEMQTKHQRSKR